MSPALNRGVRKAVRTLLQLAAGGALTAAVNQFADGLSPNAKVLVLTGWTVIIALIQNTAETSGKVPVVLPAPGLVTTAPGRVVAKTVGVVDATAETLGGAIGDVEGVVTDMTGDLLGEVIPPGEGEP